MVNDLKTVKLESRIDNQSGPIGVMSYFISKGKNVFIFHGLASIEQYSDYKMDFRNSMNGFQTLRDKTKLNVKPDRIRLITLSKSMTLKHALKSSGITDDKLNELALINGKELTEKLEKNTVIKIIKK